MNRLDHSRSLDPALCPDSSVSLLQARLARLDPSRLSRGCAHVSSLMLAGALLACSRAPLPEPVSQAQAVSHSKAAAQAQEFAPQAFEAAEHLKNEALALHDEHREAESEAAGAQALAAYNEAFALSQISIAQERLEQAQKNKQQAQQQLSQLDTLQAQVSQDAEGFELQVRVALDTEAVKDVDKLTPARAEARRLAAKQLTAEAALLCLGARLLHAEGNALDAATSQVTVLEKELGVGSVKTDLYPRSADARALCLKELSLARRKQAERAPQSAQSDVLLAALSSAGKYMVFRDDRGVVVNIGQPLSGDRLTDEAQQALQVLGATAKKYPHFPLLLVVHTRKSGEEKRAEQLGQFAKDALLTAGAPAVHVKSVGSAQPVIQASQSQAAEKNERVEVIFVVPGR